MSEPVVVLVADISPEGVLKGWKSPLPPPMLNLLLDKVKWDLCAGQVQQGSPIVPATNGDVSALRRTP